MEVIPAIDVLGVSAVRLHQGDYGRATSFGEPTTLAARFAASGARWIHLVDLDGARAGRVRPEAVRAVAAAASPAFVQASGGVRSAANALALLRAGATRVVVGTAAFRGALEEFVDVLGERLVVALDVRDGVVRTSGWTESTGLPVEKAVERCVATGVPRLLCTAIDRDGTLDGPDVALVRTIVECSRLPVLAAGGIRDESDLETLEAAGAEGAIIGRALLEGRLASSVLSRRA